MIVIIDYGMGNLRSILNKLERIRVETIISSRVEDIQKADKLILPGVGAFGNGMNNLKSYGLLNIISKKVLQEKTPILGICLGMQLFCRKSEEGNVDGLGWIDTDTIKFNFSDIKEKLRIPHMGWNKVKIKKKVDIVENLSDESKFYFVHSYHVSQDAHDITVASANYGYEFPAIIQSENIWGTQFHPEKSHHDGIQILKNFAEKI